MRWGCSSVDSPVRQGIFLPESTISADSLTVSVHPRVQSHAFTSVRTLKIPQSPVRVRWTMETLEHPACTVGWVARLCRSWLSPGKATRIFLGRNLIGSVQLLKKKKKQKKKKKVFKLLLVFFLQFYIHRNKVKPAQIKPSKSKPKKKSLAEYLPATPRKTNQAEAFVNSVDN